MRARRETGRNSSYEQREHTRIAIKPVVRNLAVAEKPDQRKLAELALDQLELRRARPEQARATSQTRVVNAAARTRIKPFFHAGQHALHVLRRACRIAPAEHHLHALLHKVADRNQAAAGI